MLPKKNRMRRVIKTLREDIKSKRFPVGSLIMFGSFARGEISVYSDLDICVVCDSELTDREKYELQFYFHKILENEIEPDFLYCTSERLKTGVHVFESIRAEGEVLYGDIQGNIA